MSVKRRLSASVDAELLEAGRAAVAAGESDSLSAWINQAMRRQAEHDVRLRALDEFLGAFAAKHGALTDDEIAAAGRRARAGAQVIRGSRGAA